MSDFFFKTLEGNSIDDLVANSYQSQKLGTNNAIDADGVADDVFGVSAYTRSTHKATGLAAFMDWHHAV